MVTDSAGQLANHTADGLTCTFCTITNAQFMNTCNCLRASPSDTMKSLPTPARLVLNHHGHMINNRQRKQKCADNNCVLFSEQE